MSEHDTLKNLEKLVWIMERLRDPDTGCPWDIEQDFKSIAPYTIEEAYEVADAIEREDLADLREELGDLLLQVVFHSQMAKEGGAFNLADVADSINRKMVRRHPHVFGDEVVTSADAQTRAWEDMKALERAEKGKDVEDSALDGVAKALPALLRAEKLTKRAARAGFDWPDHSFVLEKLDEEVRELEVAVSEQDQEAILDEMGDVLFVVANLARKLRCDPEEALRKANQKFERRFRAMERLAASRGTVFSDLDLEAQEALWTDVKVGESGALSASEALDRGIRVTPGKDA